MKFLVAGVRHASQILVFTGQNCSQAQSTTFETYRSPLSGRGDLGVSLWPFALELRWFLVHPYSSSPAAPSSKYISMSIYVFYFSFVKICFDVLSPNHVLINQTVYFKFFICSVVVYFTSISLIDKLESSTSTEIPPSLSKLDSVFE